MKKLAILFMGLAWGLQARTKLTTLPERESVQLDISNEKAALVEEERTVTLQKGRNQVEFAWSGVSIDMSTIQFRPIKSPGKVNVLNVNYPPGESALFWEVSSEQAGPAVFRISYIIHGMRRVVSYEAVASKNEKTLLIRKHNTLQNSSGERYTGIQLKLGMAKELKKDIENGESRKILTNKYTSVKITKAYHYDKSQMGDHVRLLYEIENSRDNGMGHSPVEPGKARIFQEDSSGSEAFLGEDWAQYTGRGQMLKLFLGQAKEVKVGRSLIENKEEKVKEPVKQYRQVIRYQVENFKNATVPVTLFEHPGGEWELTKVELKEEVGERNEATEKTLSSDGKIRWEKKDIDNLEIYLSAPPTGKNKLNVYLHLVLKNRW